MSFLDKLNESFSDNKNREESNIDEIEELELQSEKDYKNNKIEGKNKSLFGKHNDNPSESNDNDDLYQKEYEELELQLKKANESNNKQIEEINELKILINEYINHINYMKYSYEESIEELKAQLNFEKEINDRYLTKIVEFNKSLSEDVNDLKTKSQKDNEELISLFNSNNDELNNSTNKIINQLSDFSPKNDSSNDINVIKEFISNNNKEMIDLINDIKNQQSNSKNMILEQLASQQNSISAIYSPKEKIDNLEELIKNNYNNVSNLISENKENQNNANSKIIEEISNKSQENISESFLLEIKDMIQANNDKLINGVNGTQDVTKIEIFNRISDDLKNGNYVNLDAYKKINEMGLFDEEFYKTTYDYNLDIDPLLHFIYKGYAENKKPSEDFHPLQYKESNINVKESNLNPLVYFVTTGLKEGNIKINENLEEIKHINKFEIDKEIDLFNIRGVKKSKRKPRILVSLTSIPERIDDVHYTLYSLLNQEVKPDKVILWLSNEQFPNGEIDLPKEILRLKQNGLSLRFCDDLKSYKKIIPTLKTYPKDIIVTADDDIFYPTNWLKILYDNHKNNPDMIIAHRVKRMNIDDEGKIDEYTSWSFNEEENDVSYLNFATGCGGVLYPPNSFYEDFDKEDIFLDICKYSNDIWLWAMAVLNHKKFKVAENKLDSSLTYVNPAREKYLTNERDLDYYNVNKGCNDIQMKKIIDKYPEIINIIHEE